LPPGLVKTYGSSKNFLEYHHIENRQKRAGKDRELHTWCMEKFECEVNEMAAMSEESSSLKPGGAGEKNARSRSCSGARHSHIILLHQHLPLPSSNPSLCPAIYIDQSRIAVVINVKPELGQ
jgi:hypothetical protein